MCCPARWGCFDNPPLPGAELAAGHSPWPFPPPASCQGSTPLRLLPLTELGEPQPSSSSGFATSESQCLCFPDILILLLMCGAGGRQPARASGFSCVISLPSLPSAAPSHPWESRESIPLLPLSVAFPPLSSFAPLAALYPPLPLS